MKNILALNLLLNRNSWYQMQRKHGNLLYTGKKNGMNRIPHIENEISELRNQLQNHKLYKNLNNVASYNDNNNVNVFYYKNDFV